MNCSRVRKPRRSSIGERRQFQSSRTFGAKIASLATVRKVFQNLLRERVSIRDAVSVLEALGEAAPITKNTVLLTEYVWQAVRRQVVKPMPEPSGDLSGYSRESDRFSLDGSVRKAP